MSKTYLCSYPFKGSEWCLKIDAEDEVEARERLKALCWAKFDGELVMELPAHRGGFMFPFIVAVRNFFKGAPT